MKRKDSKANPDCLDAPKENWGTWGHANSDRVDEPRVRCPGFSELTPAQRMRWLEDALAAKYLHEGDDLS